MNVLVCAVHIVPYLKKYKANPCTGQPLEAKGLIKLNYQKNAAGEYHCPVMYKVSTYILTYWSTLPRALGENSCMAIPTVPCRIPIT